MNISAFTIYLWQLADKAIEVSGAMCIILVLSTVACSIFGLITYCCTEEVRGCYESEEEAKQRVSWNQQAWPRGKKLAVRFGIGALLMSTVYTLIPSSNTIAMMVVIPKIAESKVIQQDVPEIYNAAVEALKQQLKGK